MVIDNLSNGFDLYNIPRMSLTHSLVVPTNKVFVRQSAFTENGTAIVCRSDHGKIYIFGTEQGERVQILHHTIREIMVQTIEMAAGAENHLIATGSSADCSDICIWAKPVSIN